LVQYRRDIGFRAIDRAADSAIDRSIDSP